MATRKHTECVRKFVSEASSVRGSVTLTDDNVVEVWVGDVSDEVFDDVLFKVQMMLYSLPGGHSWGTDGVGYLCNKRGHFVEVHKVLTKSCAAELRKIAPHVVV